MCIWQAVNLVRLWNVDAAHVLTVLTALELLAVLLLQGQLSLQLGDASLGQLPAQLLVFLNQHSTLGHQFLPRLAVRETSLTSHSEPGDKHNRQRDAIDLFQQPDPQAEGQQKLFNLNIPKLLCSHNRIFIIFQFNIKWSGTHWHKSVLYK